jgi:hypothetical protein
MLDDDDDYDEDDDDGCNNHNDDNNNDATTIMMDFFDHEPSIREKIEVGRLHMEPRTLLFRDLSFVAAATHTHVTR